MTDLPTLDPQQAEDAYQTLQARLAAFAPVWQPAPGSPGDALLRIYARTLHVLAERINRAPHKNRLAMLDRLGISLIPDQAARAPVVFTMQDGARNSRAMAGLRLGAAVPGLSDPVIFETEQAIGLTSARLAEVWTIWPGRDEYADLSVDAIGGQPVRLFTDLEPIPHELYLAHDTHFALSGSSIVELQVQLARPSSEPLTIIWEYWDGEAWREFKPFVPPTDKEAAENDSLDGTLGLTRSGVIRLVAECGANAKATINHIAAYWVRGRLAQKLVPDPARSLPDIDTIRVRTIITNQTEGDDLQPLDPDAAYAGGIELDVTKAFFPFGQDTQSGATFYLTNEEVLTKPGAKVRVSVRKATTPQQESDTLAGGTALAGQPAVINWEYWNGSRWLTLPDLSTGAVKNFRQDSGTFEFSVPEDLSPTEVAGVEGLWLRARITSGSFNRFSQVSWTPQGQTTPITIPVVSPRPVSLDSLKLGYDYRAAFAQPQWCLTYSDFQWTDRTGDASWRGLGFEPFPTVQDRTPTLYLGFEGTLPPDLLSLYFDIAEADGHDAPRLAWEYWDGELWSPLTVRDETGHFATPGMVQVVYPGVAAPPSAYVVNASGQRVTLLDARQAAQFRLGDMLYIHNDDGGELATLTAIDGKTLTLKTPLGADYAQAALELAGLARFGTPRAWLRARLQSDGTPHQPTVNGIYPNAVWASQTNTIRDELVGFSNGQREQVFFLAQTPVLDGDVIEVRELDGPRAEVELPILEEDLHRSGHPTGALRAVRDPVSGRVNEVWVRWFRVPSLLFSGPADRHYVLESTQGRLQFGDGVRGRVPPSGANNIVARQYRTGGGKTGNVP
ncbi:MAG: hypothetical protein JW910_07260, partial [Anaerolineae bacterium]|nr:hypothetical protein [Anaerolineae bacterium]